MQWREILEKVERGELSAEEGAALMGRSPANPATGSAGAASGASTAPAKQAPTTQTANPDQEMKTRLAYWKRWWMLPLWVGMGIFLVGAALVAWGHAGQHNFWFVCGFLPLLLGLLAMFLSWWSQTAHWLHVRVNPTRGNPSKRVNISMPIPIRLAGWLLRNFGDRIPGLKDQAHVREALPALFKAMDQEDAPLVVEVNEEDGSQVQVYLT
jgi:hypothetical protein